MICRKCRTPYGANSRYVGQCLRCLVREKNALAAATGTAKTPQAAECEASQSGPQGNAQTQSGDSNDAR